MKCFINDQEFLINENAIFSDKSIWIDFIDALQNENNIALIPLVGLLEKELITIAIDENKLDSKTAIFKLQSRIDANNQTIKFIRSKL
jgi:hypothetical protein